MSQWEVSFAVTAFGAMRKEVVSALYMQLSEAGACAFYEASSKPQHPAIATRIIAPGVWLDVRLLPEEPAA